MGFQQSLLYNEGIVGIPLTFVYISFAVGDPVIKKMVGIPLTFVYICFAVGDPVI
jgi:hypothetical protein